MRPPSAQSTPAHPLDAEALAQAPADGAREAEHAQERGEAPLRLLRGACRCRKLARNRLVNDFPEDRQDDDLRRRSWWPGPREVQQVRSVLLQGPNRSAAEA